MKKINFKQPKYMLPLILYLPVLFVGYMLIKTFHTETADTTDPRLKTTDYLSSELPEANTDSVLGSKMDNTEDMYGKISDLSGVENVENDNDSVNKKQDYESRYSEREANQLAQQQAEQEAYNRHNSRSHGGTAVERVDSAFQNNRHHFNNR